MSETGVRLVAVLKELDVIGFWNLETHSSKSRRVWMITFDGPYSWATNTSIYNNNIYSSLSSDFTQISIS